MDCMVDYVGLFSGCGGQTPLSGQFLNQLPGIQFANVEEIANADQIDWSGVFSDLQQTTKDTFKEDILAEFAKQYQLKQITQTVDLGKNIDITSLTAPVAGTQNGLLIEMMQQGSQCIGSNMTSIYIQQLSFYYSGVNINPAITITFKDADLLTNELVLTPSGIVAGWNTVSVEKSFNAKRLYVLASGNFDNYVELDLSNFNLTNFGGWVWGGGNSVGYLSFQFGGSCGIMSRIQGVGYTSSTNIALTGQNSFGLSVVMSTKCGWDIVVCNNKKHFASAWQHLLGIELLNYRLNTSRLNRWASIDKKQGADLQKLLVCKYRGGTFDGVEYPGKLRIACEMLNFNDSDGCLRANDYIIHRESRL